MDASLLAKWVGKFRILTLALIFSGALNIGLIAAFIFSFLTERNASLVVAMPAKGGGEEAVSSMGQMFRQMEKLSFHELVTYLTNRDLIEEGYSKRDIALGALVSFHRFHIDRALSNAPLQRRIVSIGDEKSAVVFPGLREDQFEAIIRFAYEEKWPLTSEGIYELIKKWSGPLDSSLIQAFLVTPEFHALNVLFQKTDSPQEAVMLFQLAMEGDWETLDRFAKEQAQLLDLTVERRRRLILNYLAQGSSAAAQLLLATDFAFAAKRLEDQGILDLIRLLKPKNPESERLCVELLRAPRADAVWQAAAEKLYAFAGETLPQPLDLAAARSRFAPGTQGEAEDSPAALAAAPKPAPAPPKHMHSKTLREHVVKDGESLWKISRQHKVKIEDISKLNDLEKDRIYPGMILKIPN